MSGERRIARELKAAVGTVPLVKAEMVASGPSGRCFALAQAGGSWFAAILI